MNYRSKSFGPSYIEQYVLLGTNQNLGDHPSQHYLPRYCGDPTFGSNWSDHHMYFKSAPMQLSNLLGVGSYTAEKAIFRDDLLSRPRKILYSGENDAVDYGSLFNSFNFLNQKDSGAALREHGVHHVKLVGTASDVDPTPLYSFDGEYYSTSFGGNIPSLTKHVSNTIDRFIATDITPDGYFVFLPEDAVPFYCNTIHPDIDFVSFWKTQVDLVRSEGEIYFYPVPSNHDVWQYRVSDMADSSTFVDNHIHIDTSYELEMIGYGYYLGNYVAHHRYRVHYRFDASYHEYHGTNNPFDTNFLSWDSFSLSDTSTVDGLELFEVRDGVVYDDSYYGFDLSTPPKIQLAGNNADGRYFPTAFCLPSQSVTGLGSNIIRFRKLGSSDSFRVVERLNTMFDRNIYHIRPSCFYSASDALATQTEAIKANHVQNLQHVAGILELLPDLSEIGPMVAKLSTGDISVIVDIIDYLAETVLKNRFQQAPISRDLAELAKTDLAKSIKDATASGYYTCHGSFSYTFSDDENPMHDGVMKLVTHSKVRFFMDLSNLLATIYGANAIGILPNLSRLWDLVPFSFVVNWFTNEGERIKQVDNQFHWLAVTTQWCVHSYKLTWYPSSDFLLPYWLESDPDDPFGVSVYRRELTRCMPVLRESKFDFLKPTHGPNPVTVGALTWTLLRNL